MTTRESKRDTSEDLIIVRELSLDSISPNLRTLKQFAGTKIVTIGRSGSGKTQINTALLFAKRNLIPCGLIMSGTESATGHYGQFVPRSFVYHELNIPKIEELITRQKNVIRERVANPWAMLLLDDVCDEPAVLNKSIFHTIAKNSRNFMLFFILSLQYAMDVKPHIRSNMDGVFILRDPILYNRERIYKNWASIIPSFELFCTLMDQVTTDYTALYINNRSTSNDWRECVFWYKSPPMPTRWRFGCSEFDAYKPPE